MISVPASVTTALNSPSFGIALCISLPGNGTTFSLTDHWRNLTLNGTTYVANSFVISGTDEVKRDKDINVDSYTITVDNAELNIYEDYAQVNLVGQEATVDVAFVNPDTGVILGSDAGIRLYKGLVDSWVNDESGSKATFGIRLTSHWAAFNVVKGRVTNSASQEERYPGDTLFEFSFQDELQIKWGT